MVEQQAGKRVFTIATDKGTLTVTVVALNGSWKVDSARFDSADQPADPPPQQKTA